ncbi:MAG: AMP-binding protein [Burkholderiaceae bacterium]|nr:AMP-binding protein [Burkholderiaceae bacterium]
MERLTYPAFTPHFERSQWALPTVLEYQAVHRAKAPFLSWTDEGPTYTYGQTNAIVNRLARGFARLGVSKGDFVVLFLPNCVEYVFAWFALSKLGAVEVTVSDMYKGDFLRHQANLSKARIIVTTPELTARLAEIESELVHIERCIVVDEQGADAAPSARLERMVTSSFSALYETDDSNLGIAVTPADTAAVLFTSGTTGLSKGVLMPHSQIYFFAEEDAQMMGLKPDDVFMTAFPLFHGNAQLMTVYPCVVVGAHCVLYQRFSASEFIGRARRSGATLTNLLGSTMAFICAQPPSPDDRQHRLRRVYSAPLSPELAPVFTERFGVSDFVDGFGQTEISLVFMTHPEVPRPPGASGVLMDQWFEIRLADPDTDEEVPEGEVGELLVRHKVPGTICDGYLGMPEKTVETWRNLWFHTGDALRRDAQGWYYFVDRVKDALRRRGENISSFEVESVIRSHPEVTDCAVVAVKADEKGGEDEVKACVIVTSPDKVSYVDLIRWCEARMPYFMVPRYIEYLEALPQTPSQKVRKKELRDAGITRQTWDRVAAGCELTEQPANSRQKARK